MAQCAQRALLLVMSLQHVRAEFDTPSAAAEQLQAELQAAADSGKSSFRILPKDYDFGATVLTLNGARDMEIDGRGATLWFEVGGGMMISNSVAIKTIGLTIDYKPTLAQGRVVDCCGSDGKTFTADLDTAFLLPSSSAEWFNTNNSVKIAFWDPVSLTMLRNSSLPAAINIFARSYESVTGSASPRHVRFRVKVSRNIKSVIPTLLASAMVTIFPRGGHHSLAVGNCSKMQFTNLSIFGGSSMGVVESDGIGGHQYQRLLLGRRPLPGGPQRLLSVNADGFHSTGNKYGPTLEDSDLGFTGDDVGNVCSPFFILLNDPSSRIVTIIDHSNALSKSLNIGNDTVSFFRLNTMVPLDGPIRVLNMRQATDSKTIAKLDAARSTLMNPPYAATFQDAAWNHPKALDLELDRAPSGSVAALWSVVSHDQAVDVGPELLNSFFHDGYARAWMLKARRGRILGSSFARSGGIHIGVEQNWLEGDPGITDVLVANNMLEACGQPSISIDDTVRGSVTLQNNTDQTESGIESRSIVV